MIDLKQNLEQVIGDAVRAVVPEFADTPVGLDRPKQAAHGDYASNIALSLAKRAKRNPRELAQALVAALPASGLIDHAEIAGAGFINIFVTAAARQAIVARVLAERDDFGTLARTCRRARHGRVRVGEPHRTPACRSWPAGSAG